MGLFQNIAKRVGRSAAKHEFDILRDQIQQLPEESVASLFKVTANTAQNLIDKLPDPRNATFAAALTLPRSTIQDNEQLRKDIALLLPLFTELQKAYEGADPDNVFTKWSIWFWRVILMNMLHDELYGRSKKLWKLIKKREGTEGRSLRSMRPKYYDKEGVIEDAPQLDEMWSEAAEQGNAEAQYNLGVMYANGDGVPKDAVEAVKWFRKAAEQGHAKAQYNFGLMYYNGKGVPEDYSEAVKLFRMASERGNADAQHNLGVMYSDGEGVQQDDTEAVKWYRLAAEQGKAQSQFNLGMKYGNGEGVTEDALEAVKWFRLAAEQGNANAQYNLGLRYAVGLGVIEDMVEAHAWLNVASAQGYEVPNKNLTTVEEEMTKDQIAEATELAREYFKKYGKKK